MNSYRILCVSADREFLLDVRLLLKSAFKVTYTNLIDESILFLQSQTFDLVLLDVPLSEIDAIRRLKSKFPSVDIAIVSDSKDNKLVVSAIHEGAIDFLPKPFDVSDIEAVIGRQVAARHMKERYKALVEAHNQSGFSNGIVYKSQVMARVLTEANHLKGHKANVLIVGETGTGKELLARYIHKTEGDNSRPFVTVNCAAIPENLIETELFGSEAGAYTGAMKRRIGKFELADGGDIFLDEVGSLNTSLQAKILRVLQEKEFSRVGSNEVLKADFRVVSATNEPLQRLIGMGDFRIDLYHRLRVIELAIPPLRDRMEDIPLLAEFFLKKFTNGGRPKQFVSSAMARLLNYNWPGNVRELSNVIHSIVILSRGDVIGEEAFPAWVLNNCGPSNVDHTYTMLPQTNGRIIPLREYVALAQKRYIEFALCSCSGDKSKTAKKLQLGRTTLYEKMKELGLM